MSETGIEVLREQAKQRYAESQMLVALEQGMWEMQRGLTRKLLKTDEEKVDE